jgi:soluble lytic murein transglycosylase
MTRGGRAEHRVTAEETAAASRGSRRRRVLLRRLALLLLVLAGIGFAWYQVHQSMPAWYARLWYPLEHEEAIRAEARRNGLDPALVAAVIEAESGFVPDSRSARGAVGLMQVLPQTARFVTGLPRRPSPPPTALSQPAPNIAYGTRYLAYLVQQHGSVDVAVAAYNAGETNVERWLASARRRGEHLRLPQDLPFPETRGYVREVLRLQRIYRRAYGDRLAPLAS